MKNILLLIILLATAPTVASSFDTKYDYRKTVYHSHNESSYQHAYCFAHNGIEEYQNKDMTRVDCLTDEYAIEFDFASKWAEGIGQALHYGLMTGRKPKVVLILDAKCKQEQMKYFERIKNIGKTYNIDVEYISDEILNIDSKNRCQNADCKCNKKKYVRFLQH